MEIYLSIIPLAQSISGKEMSCVTFSDKGKNRKKKLTPQMQTLLIQTKHTKFIWPN